MNVLGAKKEKAHKYVAKATKVQQTLEERKNALAAQIDHSLEAAGEKRTQQLRNVQFKAANVIQKHKAVVTTSAKTATQLASRIADSLQQAAEKRTRILSARAGKAAAFNAHHEVAVQRARANKAAEAKELASQLETRMQAAEYLSDLAVKIRKSKAALINEHAHLVSSRRRLTDAVAPMIANAKIRAELYLASNRRSEGLEETAAKAHKFVERVTRTVATEQVRAQAAADAARVQIQQKLADASARKEDLLHSRRENAVHLRSPVASGRISPEAAARGLRGLTTSMAHGAHSAPSSPVSIIVA